MSNYTFCYEFIDLEWIPFLKRKLINSDKYQGLLNIKD